MNFDGLIGRYTDTKVAVDGRLRVNVFDVSVGRPLGGAKISVIKTSGNGDLVEEVSSNDYGASPLLSLPCPPRAYSQEPNGPQPYAEYTVRVDAEGFDSAQINGVQILDDATALQQINLFPVQSQRSTLLDVKPHTLWGEFPPKIPEDPVKELPPESGFVVLDKPVVPQTIVVHEGPPQNTAGKNYYVPFKDYISNVACCEIYATWPQATLRANILAIISLTLNRVFTEWYRNKGYNFTITNSTAYDQAFSYGRNIFEDIANVVDDIFTTYITKPGIRQPLFTQYCDGKNSICPTWMSQWGSKDLGDQGLNDIDILRNYYGDQIILNQAEKVTGIPSSYPGNPLVVGSKGNDVKTIQNQLNTISNNFPAIPKQKVDGIYGDQTAATVKKFQEVFNMPQSGVVDFATWYKISEIYVAVAKLAEIV